MERETCDNLVVGAGLAGLASAYYLARTSGSVCVVEAEKELGAAASGQNASMVCRLEEDAAVAALMTEGARILEEEWTRDLPCPGPRRTGSLFVSSGCAGSDKLEAMAMSGARLGVISDLLEREEALRIFPFLKDCAFDTALYVNADGVLDVKALVSALAAALKKLGVRLEPGIRARVRRAGDAFEAETPRGAISAKRIVNAAGAWAGEVAAGCGAQDFDVKPLKRHIFVTGGAPWVSPEWPIVWDVTHNMYFRPETGGFMVSPCDEEPWRPGPAPVSDGADGFTRKKLSETYPPAQKLPFVRSWAGLRTFSPDRRFVIGPDSKVPNFIWAACLGGHGVSACAAVGKLVALYASGRKVNPALVRAFSPARFA